MKSELFIEDLLKRARRAGFTEAEAYLSQGDSFEAGAHEGKINSYEVSSSFGLGFRGVYKGKIGYASTQVLDEEAADQLIEGAKTNAALMDEEEAETLFEGAKEYPAVQGFHPQLEKVSAAEKLEKLLALEKTALSLDNRVKSLGDCGLMSAGSALRIVNTLGLNASFEDNLCGMYVSPTAKDGEETSSGFRFMCRSDFDELDVDRLAREAVAEAISGLGGEQVPSGSYPVIFRNDVTASILQTFSGIFSAEAAQKGLSLLKGREGETIASRHVTILDDPLLKGGFASTPFDGEGVPSAMKSVAQDGVLRTLLHNRKTAAKQGVHTTGNAQRSYAGRVSVSPTNFYFKPGTVSLGSMMKEMGTGLFITQVQGLHAGANSVTGDFSLGAKGFRVANGEITGPVSGVTVAGNFFALLKQIEMLSDDLYFGAPGGACFGGPSIWAGSLTVAGK